MTKNTRREFLIATAGVGVWSVADVGHARSASERLNIGFIGVTGRGGQNIPRRKKNADCKHTRVSTF